MEANRLHNAQEGLLYHLRKQLNLNQVPCDEKRDIKAMYMPEMAGINQERIIDTASKFDTYCRPCEIGHATRTAIYMSKMVYALRMKPEQATFLIALAAYHDCGKSLLIHLKNKPVLTIEDIQEIRTVHIGPAQIRLMSSQGGQSFASSIERSHVTEGYPKEFSIPSTPESEYASTLLETVDKIDAGLSREHRDERRFLSFEETIAEVSKVFREPPRKIEYEGGFFPQLGYVMTASGLVSWGVLNRIFEKPKKGFIFRRGDEEARMNPFG